MKCVSFFAVAAIALCANAWVSIDDMEADISIALTNDSYLLSADFTNQLNAATSSQSAEMRSEAHMLLSMNAYKNFLDTAEESWIPRELSHASNAVVAIGANSDKWQFWMARLVHSLAYVSLDDYTASLGMATNTIAMRESSGYTNETSSLERAILSRYEMCGVDLIGGLKITAGMAAASAGQSSLATNYANQVSSPYREIILEFVR